LSHLAIASRNAAGFRVLQNKIPAVPTNKEFLKIYVQGLELLLCVLGFVAIAWLKRSCKWSWKPRERATHN
jgi:hypothetical protein